MNDMNNRDWILVARHANPNVYDMIQLVAA
jgi:hypothetical protein